MELTQLEQERLEALSPVLKHAYDLLMSIVEKILNGKCNEEAIINALAIVHNNNEGRYCDEELLTYDKAAVTLGLQPTNRMGLVKLCKLHNISQVKIHNMKVGFPRDLILLLRDKIVAEKNDRIRKEIIRKTKKLELNGTKNNGVK